MTLAWNQDPGMPLAGQSQEADGQLEPNIFAKTLFLQH